MKPLLPLATLAVTLALASCIQPGPGYYPPPVPGPPGPPRPPVPGPPVQSQRDEAYRLGWGFGRRDALQGRQSNYLLYNNYYNSTTKKDFGAGYMTAYRRFRR